MTRVWLLAVAGWFAFSADAATLSAQQPSDGLSAVAALEQAITQVIEQAEPSVVSVARIRNAPNEFARGGELRFGPMADSRDPTDLLPNQFGTGVIVAPPNSDERFVLTAYHVVKGGPITNRTGSGSGSVLQVWFPSEQTANATIYAADPRSDLAVLKLDLQHLRLKPSQLRPISWSSAAPVRKGQFVVTLGNPYWIARDGSASAAWGIVSNLVRRPAALNYVQGGPPTLLGIGVAMQLEQKLPVGASGSPVINLRNELVGIASSMAAIEGYDRSGGFAMPIDATTRWIIESLLAGREVEYGLLGLQPQRTSLSDLAAERYGQASAAKANRVPPGSPAYLAGVRENDVILAVDGVPTRSDVDLMRQATLHPPETLVQLLVLRGTSSELTIKVKLGKWPHHDEESVIATERRYPIWRGLAVDYPTARQRKDPETLQSVPAAVVISEVLPDSPAQAAHLERYEFITHVNKTPVRTPAEFAEAVKTLKGDVTLRLRPLDWPVGRNAEDAGRTVVIKER